MKKENRESQPTVERRFVPAMEFRVTGDTGSKKIEGYSARFNSESEDMGFIETIAPGAFKNALAKSDVRALFNHSPDYILGRAKAGTLSLAEDDVGLRMEVTPPDTQWARDLLTSIERGDITGQSFSFTLAKGGDAWSEQNGKLYRTITEFGELFDVGPVVFPAYKSTDVTVALRSMEEFRKATEHEERKGFPTRLARAKLALSGLDR